MNTNPNLRKILMILFFSLVFPSFILSINSAHKPDDSANQTRMRIIHAANAYAADPLRNQRVRAFDTGNISLSLKDQCSNAPISDAQIVARKNNHIETHDFQSPAPGEYLLSELPQGHYELTIQASGYETLTESGVMVYPLNTTNSLGARLLAPHAKTYFRDSDGDGYGNPNDAIQAACQPVGYVSIAGDCDDSDPGIHPGASEICDGKDNNCDGQIDEGLPAVYQGSLINKYSGQKISEDGMITVSWNDNKEMIDAVGGDFAISLIPNTRYTLTFEVEGYELLRFSIPAGTINACEIYPGKDIGMTPAASLSDVILILKIMSGIDAPSPKWLKNQKVEMFHAIRGLQNISGLRG